MDEQQACIIADYKYWQAVAAPWGCVFIESLSLLTAARRTWDNPSVSPIVRQSLLHWAYELTEADFEAMRKGS